MDGSYAFTPAVPGPSSFYYYTPGRDPQTHPHSQYTQPGDMQPYNGVIPAYSHGIQPPQMHSHMAYMPQQHFQAGSHPHMLPGNVHLAAPMAVTPISSPQPHRKPTIIVQSDSPALMPLDTRCGDMYFMPSTPPLSSSGSASSSPPSTCGLLPTPNGESFFINNLFEGVKEGCEGEVHSELLATGDWSRAGSPPMTPGKFLIAKIYLAYKSPQFGTG